MPENNTGPNRRKKLTWKFRIFLCFAAALAVWLLHAPVLSWGAREALAAWCSANRLTFSADKVDVRLDGPVVFEGVRFRSAAGTGRLTVLDISRIEWRWGGGFFSENGRLIRKLSVSGVTGVWDFSGKQESREAAVAAGGLLRLMPQKISLSVPALDLLDNDRKLSVRDLSATFSESDAGQLSLDVLTVRTDSFSRAIGPIRARTAWKYGTLWLAAMEILPGIAVGNLSADLLHNGGPALSFTADCFGGSLRGDAAWTAGDGTLDIAAWAANIPLDSLAALAGVHGQAAGKLAEGRFTFRGKPGHPADAEASLRLVAEGFQWNKRGWESLEVGASLIHRRLVVSEFELRQKENRVGFSGEISLANGWSEITRAPFLLSLKADIRELGALAGLLGGPLDEAGGRMTATGSVSGQSGRVDGFLSVEASEMTFRSLPPSSLRAEAVFREGGIEIANCDLFSQKDTASLRGTVSQTAPYQYAAEVNARIADIAACLAPFHAPGAEQIYGGALDVRWQGDGTAKSHSGAFDVKLGEFVSGATPSGLTGEFTGTYSPQNVYFSKLRITKSPLQFDSRATFASSGITLKDVELRAGNTSLIEGSAFVPINFFSVLEGQDWRAAIDPEREAYLRAVTPQDLNLRSLLDLAGQNFPMEGRVRFHLEAGGPPARLTAKGDLVAQDIVWKQPGLPPSRLGINFSALDGKASLDGMFETKGFPSLLLAAHMPFGLVRTDTGNWRWLNPTGAFDASIDFPRADLAVFRPLFPKLQQLAGSVYGKLAFSGTIGEPKTAGWVAIKDGAFDLSTGMPPVRKIHASLVFDGTRVQVEQFSGEIGTGPFEISGSVGLADPSNPAWNLHLMGKKISLAREVGILLFANVDLAASGNNASGALSGAVRLVDARISRRLRITPGLLVEPEKPGDAVIPPPSAMIPEPFARWTLDVKVANESPFVIRGNMIDGEIIPSVTLTGTLGRPVPVGRVTLKDVSAFLPFTVMMIPDGRVDFLPDTPWVPMLDVRGSTQTAGYKIQAFAFGPMDQAKLILRAEPPLPQESLVLLLTTGIGGRPPEFGAAAVGGSGLPLFFLQLDIPGGDCLQPTVRRSLISTRGQFQFWNDEHDGYRPFPDEATYTWRLQY
ncbi:MAG: translocation/assembly module TamB domain-containing protein [Verrucomicrobiae bacterium]